MEQIPAEQKPPRENHDTLRSEHLNPGERPIIACVEGTDDEKPEGFVENYESVSDLISEAQKRTDVGNVIYEGNPRWLKAHGFLNDGLYTYAISPINSRDKFSTGYIFCTGVAVVGKDKTTGENISFFTHQDPHSFLPNHSHHNNFVHDLHTRLSEMKDRCASGTIDVIIAGGDYVEGDEYHTERYRKSIALLAKEISSVLGFQPVIVTGPKAREKSKEQDDILFDNKNRRLYISRPHVGDTTTESYLQKDYENQSKKWGGNEWDG